MNTRQYIIPQTQAPELELKLLDGNIWKLKDQNPKHFTMLVFYRGLHCPVCGKYLKTLDGLIEAYAEKGLDVIAISMDDEVRARTSKIKWQLSEKLNIAYGLDAETASKWGLYLSKAVKDHELDVFNEPGLFLIRPDNSVYYVAINSIPWGRPHLPTFIKAIDYIISNDYPARGEIHTF